uniref:NitT/TauT family transport system substrate-binding protein n=1 Tax=Candidatus Kentrum sp. TUN TaxID=2126343 RepID=A0A450ZID6_9GAMM|nr:MAG: NitT/TauT family transport system substrate-binding protein [Candidatus Kentron sp. TUN]VFK53521.1 MAG: NitT/TauT family transport system substrate-binding protein [Candidatus Kentron sp. TUN]
MKTNIKKWVIFIVSGVFFIILAFIFSFSNGKASQEKDREEIVLGIATWAGFGTGIVGVEKGYFPTINLQTKVLDDARARQAAFVAGDIDIMVSSIDLYAQEAAKKIPGKIFLVTDESQGGDGIVAKAEIKTITDLRGKKVAYAHGGPSDYFLFKVLDDAGVALTKLTRVAVDDPSRAGDVFLSGDVDAAVTWEPFLTNSAESGKGHILITTKEMPEIIVDILIANDKLMENEKVMREFLDGWLNSVDYIKANSKEAAEILAAKLNLSVEDVQGMMAGLKFSDRERNKYFFDSAQPGNTRIAMLLGEAGTYWKSINIIEKPVDGWSRISATASRYFNDN